MEEKPQPIGSHSTQTEVIELLDTSGNEAKGCLSLIGDQQEGDEWAQTGSQNMKAICLSRAMKV